MKILVCGGRAYADREQLFEVLDGISRRRGPILCVVHGACQPTAERPVNADLLAEEWAKAREVAYRGYPARWSSEGKAAGPKRNARMLKQEHRPRPDPDCESCNGAGEYFGHTSTCSDKHCALAGGYDDCPGQVERCGCVAPDAPVIRVVVAFEGGKGTADMVRRARDADIEVMEVAGGPR